MKLLIDTPRLLIRSFEPDDLDALVRHRSDPEVMKFLGGVPTPDAVASRLEFYIQHFAEHGFAMGPVIDKATNKFIGVGGLQLTEGADEVEVGYTVERSHWGKGIATEITIECLEMGFRKYGLKQIIDQTQSANVGSLRVHEKA